ncbi:MAG: acetylxylan esterase [Lacisediminihabitans sp.]
MAFFDLPLEQLRDHLSQVRRPDDLEAFWATTLAEADAHPLDVRLTPVDTGFVLVDTFDVEFSGFGGDRIRSWLKLPHGARAGELPAVVEYVGYNGGRGLASEPSAWAQAGFAHLIMDNRGQGSGWSIGHTPDVLHGVADPAHAGFMTRGIRDRDTYFYRRIYTDAVRAIAAARSLEQVDPSKVFAMGNSQGGGICLAVAALVDDLVGVMANVPFLCHFERAVTITDSDPFAEIARYLAVHRDAVDIVFETLSNFDGVNLVPRATAPALFSVALMDPIVPPSTVFAAYNAYAGEKEITVYPFNGHEGGASLQEERKLRWALERLRTHAMAG